MFYVKQITVMSLLIEKIIAALKLTEKPGLGSAVSIF